jgi:hypothetical protein
MGAPEVGLDCPPWRLAKFRGFVNHATRHFPGIQVIGYDYSATWRQLWVRMTASGSGWR